MSDSSERARGEPPAEDSTLGAEAAPAADDRPWLARTWYRSRLGAAVGAVDVLLTAVLAAAASVAAPPPSWRSPDGGPSPTPGLSPV